MLRASFIYHQITAAISIFATLVLIYAIFRFKNNKMNSYSLAVVLFLASISWGVHGIIHFLEEYMFDFEPISGRNKVINKPIREVTIKPIHLR